MKLGTFLPLFLLLGASNVSGQPNVSLTGKSVVPDKPLTCNLNLLRSYLLKGRLNPSNTSPMILCPNVKSNCCTKSDLQRIYHVVNDILPPRITNYEERIKTALAAIRRFHDHIVANQPTFVGSARRRNYCMRQAQAVYNFPFSQFFAKLYDTLLDINREMRPHYDRFYCIVCDARNHPFFDFKLSRKTVTFDAKFCQNTLESRSDVINMLNIQLVSYLVSLQNLVDCKHYVRSYNLDFFSTHKIQHTVELVQCMDFIQSKDFMKYCKQTCAQLNFSKINTLLQGDLDFLNDSLNLFKKFFEFQESGNFVSTRLRKFFKNNVVEVKPGKLPDRMLKTNVKKLKKRRNEINYRFKRISEQQFKQTSQIFKKLEHQAANEEFLKKIKEKRELRQLQTQSSLTAQQAKPSRWLSDAPKIDSGVDTGRILSADSKSPPASTAQQPGAQAKPPSNPNIPGENRNTQVKLVIDKHLVKTYSIIPIEKAEKHVKHIFKMQPQPIDFDSVNKLFQSLGGVNPEFYEDLKFDEPQRVFFRKLYGETRKEARNPKLQFLLADFNDANIESVKNELTHQFKIDPDNWKPIKIKT